jgi:lipid kinase YegS
VGEALLVLNGKKAGQPDIRAAVKTLRDAQHQLDVRVTWEYGDIARYVDEACARKIERLVVGGGDGSVNEAANAILKRSGKVPALGILPLGTANDFASCCGIPGKLVDALRLGITGNPHAIDAVQANEQFFLNVASAGFGAAVTANTPVELKNFLAGGAYTISGLVQVLNFEPYYSRVRTPDKEFSEQLLIGAICNGRLAGGGQSLAPEALLDDGLMNVLMVNRFLPADVPQVLQEFKNPRADGKFIRMFKTPWLECESEQQIPVNLDGEPHSANQFRFSVSAGAIRVVLPPDCPCIKALST